ncbi:bifunctional metallophosphatase/5'-nucleotidase [Heyndrickxia oleronia]|uniref:bifunctional metallophosphatase/5'-nucleotidase n=1 Tax=Heyndrickxia oleronia TaxID=38875 RepID=UPI00203BB730|nr:bifunctional UDP-sugar hydrolase/5'-nucleotidase [Heyndrickxia oleronia]MCM3238175.1 bifunctional metallophosphatase/5'-nucleotidase [Heyndrickxia oleronia]
MLETIHIYHTNDIHSHLENWPRIRDFLMNKKMVHRDHREDCFLFDIGDHVDRWHPFTEATIGKGNIGLMNAVGYTAATIGNNEGITLSHQELDSLYSDADFDLILANVYDKKMNRPNWTVPHQIYHSKGGLKIGVTAVTAYFQKLYELLEWHVEEPFKELHSQVKELKEHVDVLILLSHLGIHDDEKIATLFPEIDVILGGHTHHILEKGKLVDQTLLAAAGKHGKFIGHVKLEVDLDKKIVTDKQAQLNETAKLPPSQNEKEEIANFYEKGRKLLFQEIVRLPESLSVEWFKESQLPVLLCEAIEEWCEADCAFINAGLLLDHLEKGMVTKYELHKILPHPINPCLIELNGRDLQNVILQTLDPKWPKLELKGLGFRGTILGNFVYTNISIEGSDMYIKDQKVQPNKIYKLGTIDMYTFGHFFPELYLADKKYFLPEFLRDVMEWKLKKKYKSEKQ